MENILFSAIIQLLSSFKTEMKFMQEEKERKNLNMMNLTQKAIQTEISWCKVFTDSAIELHNDKLM